MFMHYIYYKYIMMGKRYENLFAHHVYSKKKDTC